MSNDYMDLFVEEARENVDELIAGLLRLETEDEDSIGHTINELFRFAHNIKGMAATVGLDPITLLAHRMEDLLDRYRQSSNRPDPDTIDLFLGASDSISDMIGAIAAGNTPSVDSIMTDRLEARVAAEDAAEEAVETVESADAPDPIKPEVHSAEPAHQSPAVDGATRVIVRLVNGCALPGARAAIVLRTATTFGEIIGTEPDQSQIIAGKAAEFALDIAGVGDPHGLVTKLGNVTDVEEATLASTADAADGTEPQPVETPGPASPQPVDTQTAPQTKTTQRATVRVEVERLDDLMNLVGELVIGRGQLTTHLRRVADPGLTDTIAGLTRTISDIQAAVAKARMISLEGTFRRINRLVRDTARELGKPVDFHMEGGETELDRSMVDEVADPLVHLLRNAIDHGVENPERRAASGKPSQGSIKLTAGYEGNQVVIEVQDDGAGIDGARIVAKAIERGALDEAEAAALTPNEQIQLIFLPGLSTREEASTISGRGVGMDVVRSSVNGLGGTVEVESTLNEGSSFRIRLPLSLAVLETLLVTIHKEVWAVPLADIDETIIVTSSDLDSVLGSPVVNLRGETLPLIHGRQSLALGEIPAPPFPAVVFQVRGRRCALSVDELLEQTEVVVKPAPDNLHGVEHVSGVTILGDGTVGLIVDVGSVAEQFIRKERRGQLVGSSL